MDDNQTLGLKKLYSSSNLGYKELINSFERLCRDEELIKSRFIEYNQQLEVLNQRKRNYLSVLSQNIYEYCEEGIISRIEDEVYRLDLLSRQNPLIFIKKLIKKEKKYLKKLIYGLEIRKREINNSCFNLSTNIKDGSSLYDIFDDDFGQTFQNDIEYEEYTRLLINRKLQIQKLKETNMEMENKNTSLRNLKEQEFVKAEEKINRMQQLITQTSMISKECELAAITLQNDHKVHLDLVLRRSEIERGNFTASRDKFYSNKYIQDMQKAKAKIETMKIELDSKRVSIDEKVSNLERLQIYVQRMEKKAQNEEKRIDGIEQQMIQSGSKFETSVNKSNKELKALSQASFRKSRSSLSSSQFGSHIMFVLDEGE